MSYLVSTGDGKTRGPVSLGRLRELARAGRLPKNLTVCAEGGSAWVSLESVLEETGRAAATPTPVPSSLTGPSGSGVSSGAPRSQIRVFISHSSSDAAFAIRIATALESQGLGTWYYERDCVPGPSYLLQTSGAIDRCEVFMAIVSAASLGSVQMTREIVRAHESDRLIIPILVGLSHQEFKLKQPEWRAAFGAATAIEVSRDVVPEAIMPQIVSGLDGSGAAKPRDLSRAQAATPMIKAALGPRVALPAAALLLITALAAAWLVYAGASGPTALDHPKDDASTSIPAARSVLDAGQDTSPTSVAVRAPSVAVLEFQNLTGKAELDIWQKGLREFFSTDLAAVSGLRVVDRTRLQDVLAELQLASSDFVDPAQAVRLGKGLSAQWVVAGSITAVADQLRLDVKLIAVETSEIECAVSEMGAIDSVMLLERNAVEKLAATPALAAARIAPLPSVLGPARTTSELVALSEALAAEDRGDREALRKQLAELRSPDSRREQLPLGDELAFMELELRLLSTLEGDRKKANASAAGRFIRADLEDRLSRIAARKRGPEYFADLLIASSELGLLGDLGGERDMLVRFANEFMAAVDPVDCMRMLADMQPRIDAAGKRLQEHVDSGQYFDLPFQEKLEGYWLKDGLEGELFWPKYAMIWPFPSKARSAFYQVLQDRKDGRDPSGWEKNFEKALPGHSLASYLTRVLEIDDGDDRPLPASVVAPDSRSWWRPDDEGAMGLLSLQARVLEYCLLSGSRLDRAPVYLLMVRLRKIADPNTPLEQYPREVLISVVRALSLVIRTDPSGDRIEDVRMAMESVMAALRLQSDSALPSTSVETVSGPPVLLGAALKGASLLLVTGPYGLDWGMGKSDLALRQFVNILRAVNSSHTLQLIGLRQEGWDNAKRAYVSGEPAPAEAAYVRQCLALARCIESPRCTPDAPTEVSASDALRLSAERMAQAGSVDLIITAKGDEAWETDWEPYVDTLTALSKDPRIRIHGMLLHPSPVLLAACGRSGGTAWLIVETHDFFERIKAESLECRHWSRCPVGVQFAADGNDSLVVVFDKVAPDCDVVEVRVERDDQSVEILGSVSRASPRIKAGSLRRVKSASARTPAAGGDNEAGWSRWEQVESNPGVRR